MRLLPILLLLPVLLLTTSCDDDDDDDDVLGLVVAIPRDGKFDRHVRVVKRVAIVRGTVVSATGIPVVGAQIRITAFLVDVKFRHLVFEDRCKNCLLYTSDAADEL